LPWWELLVAVLLTDLILLLEPLRSGQVTKSGFVGARLIRHASIFQPVTVVPLTVPVVITAFWALLVFAVGFSVLLGASLLPAAVAAVALSSETGTADKTGTADTEGGTAPAADTPQEWNKPVLRHRSRKAGVDSGRWLWNAQTVTV